MFARVTKMGAVLAARAALALGGSALASAAHKSSPPTPPVAQSQANPVAPDTSAGVADNPAEAPSTAADADTLQQGDQTSSDTAASPASPAAADTAASQAGSTAGDTADPQSEQAASETGPSDGPGGYADTSASADTQQQGEH
jgi:hypothetical protein